MKTNWNYEKSDVVDVHPAWVFDCPECGVENFARSVVTELSESDGDEGEYYQTAPDLVECYECGTEYRTHIDVPGND
jgi:uncharacterized Zn finger protein